MKTIMAALMGVMFSLAVTGTQAGVAPALGTNKMSASGAKIAPPSKPVAEEQKDEKNSEPQPPKQ